MMIEKDCSSGENMLGYAQVTERDLVDLWHSVQQRYG